MSMIGIGPDLSNPATLANNQLSGKGFALNSVATTPTGLQFIYVQGATALAVGDFVHINAAGTATLLTTASSPRGNRVGVVPAVFAANERGWVQICGACPAASVLASCAANTRINTTATAGALDDDNTVGAKVIDGVVLSTARGGSNGTAPAILNFPVVGVTL